MSITAIALLSPLTTDRPCRIIISIVTPRVRGQPVQHHAHRIAHQRDVAMRIHQPRPGRGVGGQHHQRRLALAGADIGGQEPGGQGRWRSSDRLRSYRLARHMGTSLAATARFLRCIAAAGPLDLGRRDPGLCAKQNGDCQCP